MDSTQIQILAISIIVAAVVMIATIVVLAIHIGKKPPHQFKRDWEKKRKRSE